MSVDHIRWAFATRVNSPSVKLVLLALADHADEWNLCWPSLDLLVEKTELSISTVRRAISALIEDLKLVSVEEEARQHRSVRYRMLVDDAFVATTDGRIRRNPIQPACSPGTPWSDQDETQGVHGDAQGVHGDAQGVHHDTRTISNHQSNHQPWPDGAGTDLLGEPLSKPKADKPARKKKYGPHRIPEDWFPSNSDIEYADERGVDAYKAMDRFREHFLAKGVKYEHWDLVWKRWVRRAQETGQDKIVNG